MEESKNYEHQHPLLLLSNEDQLISNQCGCGGKVPCFRCIEDCGFYLHEICADAPLELNHPFHQDHPLLLMQNPAAEWLICDFCDGVGKFMYRCSSCELNFHLRCAMFTFNKAEKNLKELEHVALEPPIISSKINVKIKCYGCWELLEKYTHLSFVCGFNLHKKCAELPLKMNHMCHRKHPLVLQFNNGRLPCKICQQTRRSRTGFVYCCSPCKFAIHVKCASPTPIIEDKSHPHPFSLLLRQTPFICDGCGMEGNHVAYVCCTCNIVVHEKCISLPRIIKSKWHDHRLFHTYFFHREYFGNLDCIICHEAFNAEHGSYSCSKCNVIFHVTCVLEDEDSYSIVENEEEDLDTSVNSITDVLEWNDAWEALVVKHFKHTHYLMLSDKVSEHANKCCDGCLLPISASFYYCIECGFFLHKVCAELPKVKHVWHHRCPRPLLLTSGKLFRCEKCGEWSNAFAYKCDRFGNYTCLRCVIALTPGARTCLAHKHPLLFYKHPLLFYIKYKGRCIGCGFRSHRGLFRCKECNFSIDHKCFSLPVTVENKCDKHPLSLTYRDDNSYTESHFCDICEGRRDPYSWFYHCAICDTSAHEYCVLGKHPFLQAGSILEEDNHEHPVIVVKKIYYYPDCSNCGKRCADLSLECTKSGCNYITHYECPEKDSTC